MAALAALVALAALLTLHPHGVPDVSEPCPLCAQRFSFLATPPDRSVAKDQLGKSRDKVCAAPPPPSRTNRTRLVSLPVLTGHVSSLPY